MYNSEENIGVVKFGVYSFVLLYVDDGTYRPLEHVGWTLTVQCYVVERGHVGWPVGDNRGSTEQKQMAQYKSR